MGYGKSATTWQMKHRINTEFYPKIKYKSMTCTYLRMTVFEGYSFLGSTPDLKINCACHGPGLVEIKCSQPLLHKCG